MKPVNRKMSDDEIKVILQAERSNALGAEQSSDLSEQRIRNMEYYMGEMQDAMPADEGTSSAVSTDVQDVIEGVLPIILDTLTGEEKIMEFTPTGPGDEEAAAQETAYLNHVFYQENPGFRTMYEAVKDGLLSKNCYVKWWMEPDEARTREHYEGLDFGQFSMLLADTDVKPVDYETYKCPDPTKPGQEMDCYNVVVETVRTKKKPKIAAVPPEEILISKNAVNMRDAPYWAHIQRKPEADVIALFPEKKDIIKSAPDAVTTSDNYEAFARQTVQDNQDQLQTSDDVNKSMRMVEVAEHYIRLPLEKDDIARRYKITTVGARVAILDIEEVTAWNCASGTPIIMPHRHFGRALADLVADIQEIKTSLLRATLNNAYFANNQRVEVSETHASENTIDDLMNNRVGGIVRTKMPGGLNQLETQSIGNWVGEIITYMDGVRENRTGVSKNNTGMNIDSMNHARTGAVTQIMDAAQMRVKLIARVFAETLMTDMFRGIHGMLQEFGEEENIFKLRGEWVPVNPREWKTRTHMKVSLPLGGASKQQMLGFFAQILSVQKDVIMQTGPNGPLATYQGVYHTLDHMTKLAGLSGAEPYFTQPPPPDPNAPAPPDPKMAEAQAKAAALQQTTQAGIQADQAKAAADAQMEQVKLAAQHQREQDEFAHKVALEKMKFEHETSMEQLKIGAKLRLEAETARQKMDLEREKAELQAELDRKQAALQARQGVGEV